MGLLDGVLGSVLGGAARNPLKTAAIGLILSMLTKNMGGAGAQQHGGGGLGDLLGSVLGGGGQAGGGMGGMAGMGGLGSILGSVLGGQAPMQGQMQGGGMPDIAGGLGPMLDMLRQSGLGQQADSWVSTGPNLPLDPSVLGGLLGHGNVEAAAQQAGVQSSDLLSEISSMLPKVVDGLTPNGQLPTQQPSQGDLSALLGSLLGGQR